MACKVNGRWTLAGVVSKGFVSKFGITNIFFYFEFNRTRSEKYMKLNLKYFYEMSFFFERVIVWDVLFLCKSDTVLEIY